MAISPRARRCVEQGELLTTTSSLINDEQVGAREPTLLCLSYSERMASMNSSSLAATASRLGFWILHHL